MQATETDRVKNITAILKLKRDKKNALDAVAGTEKWLSDFQTLEF